MNDTRKIAWQIVITGFVVLFVLFFSRSRGGRAPSLGEVVPNFTLKKDDGKTVSLADFHGKVVVLNFWATWCPPCIDELPSLKQLAERYSGKGVQVLGVSLDEDPDAYRNFLVKNQIAFETVRNPNRTVSDRYGTFKLPESYIITRDGRLLRKIIGAIDWNNQGVISCFDGLVAGSMSSCQGNSL